ncbi:MAG: FAD-binding oxidoreductase [Sandaracinaceae bacterium]|nr:FAD-binding oxidoreductase [Sandaracinaceae bacterium]
MRYRREELRFNGWGRQDKTFDLRGRDREVWAFVSEALGLSELPRTPAAALDALALPPVGLDEAALARLGQACEVRTDAFERAFHAVGRSYYDLLRIRRGELEEAPDAVVYPRSHDEVVAVLGASAELGLAVVPFGGGSSVVGGVEARRAGKKGVVTLDTTMLDALLELDEVSHTATFQAGVYGPELEDALRLRGLHARPLPAVLRVLDARRLDRGARRRAAVEPLRHGGQAAGRGAPGHAERRVAYQALPGLRGGPRPQRHDRRLRGRARGDHRGDGEGAPAAGGAHFVSFLFRDWQSGALAVRRVVQAELPIATLRLSDEEETRFFGAFRGVLKPSRFQGDGAEGAGARRLRSPVRAHGGPRGAQAPGAARAARALGICTKHGGLYVGRGPGNSWYENRFEMPYLRRSADGPRRGRRHARDLHDLVEPARALRRGDGSAIRRAMDAGGRRGIVMAHISHSYLEGASLYFTYIFARDRDDEIGQWRAIKEAASEAISLHGGTISHHHGVGIDHAKWLVPEKGELGMAVLEAAKRSVDPSGIMNPGKLIAQR